MFAWRRRPVSANRSFFTTFTAEGPRDTQILLRRSSSMTRNALGRGLGALIREPEPQVPLDPPPVQNFAVTSGGAAVAPARDGAPTGGPLQIDIDLIDPSPFQPRTRFREEALDELARSIKASGIIQPLVVRSVGGRFQLIAGERRWRGGQRAGPD